MKSEYWVVFEPDDGGWTASVPDLPGCFSDADTLEQAEAQIQEAIRLWIETAKASGFPVPPPQAESKRIAV
jgi:predicted RNase H-like HicB family nuclease